MDSVKTEFTHEPFHAILAVLPLPPQFILLHYDDGQYRLVDMAEYIPGDRTGPLFVALREWDFFRRVRIDPETRTVLWPNGLDFDPSDLYVYGTPVDSEELLARTDS